MKNCNCSGSFCRSILAIYTNNWSTFWYVYCCYVYFFSGKLLNACKTITTLYPLWQPSPPGLAFYGIGPACLPIWLGIVNAGWLLFMRSGLSCKWNLSFFKTVSPQRVPFYLISLLHRIRSLSNTLDHEITLKILGFILNPIEKVKPGFSLSSMCMFAESNWTKS